MRFRLKVPWCVIGNSMRSTFTYPSDPIPSCSEFTRHCRELHPSQSMSTTSDPAPFTFRSIFFPFLPNSRNSQRAKYTHYQYYFSEVISALAKTLQIFAAKRLQLRACVHKGMHDDLHWLNVPERIQYKIGVTVHRCLQSKVPKYRTDCCTPVSDIASRCYLRSASRHHLTVPSYLLSTFGRRAFSVAGPTVWNSLPDSLRHLLSAAAASGNYLRRTTQHTQCGRDAV